MDAFLDAIEDERRREEARAIRRLMADVTVEKAQMWARASFGRYHYR